MTGKGTVGVSDAHMSNWPDGWDRGRAPSDPAARPAQPQGADEPTQALAPSASKPTQAMARRRHPVPSDPTQRAAASGQSPRRRPDPGHPAPPAAESTYAG